MFIERRNILDLIGADRRRYHSCIITCYSFDFQFFEERVMRVLRIANIKNVNVFVDGRFLERALEYTTGAEFSNHKAYGLSPIYAKGVFHPKIMLLTGHKEGLLLIGSGNLTSSGLSTNDEVWAAFHLDSADSPNAVLFGQVWQYLQSFFSQVRGFNQQKLEWIRAYTPWISQVAELGTDGFSRVGNQMDVAFLADRPARSMYQQLMDLLPVSPLVELTIVSPYYDQQGAFLNNLIAELQPKQSRCIADTQYGLLPIGMAEGARQAMLFTDWQDCIEGFDYKHSRLHAKMFHFKYLNEEYLLLGSPNATIQAFGSREAGAVNHEAAILLKRSGEASYLADLGISIPDGKSISITATTAGQHQTFDKESLFKTAVTILYAEKSGGLLSLCVLNASAEGALLVVQDEFEEVVERCELPAVNLETKGISLAESDPAFKIHLEDHTGKRISNYMLIHDADLQAKCNPDPNLQRLDELIDRVYDKTAPVTKLLDHIDYTWIDDEDEHENTTMPYRSGGMAAKSETAAPQERDYEVLSEGDFNKIDAERLFHQQALANNASVRIAEFLLSLKSGFAKSQGESFTDNEEQASLVVTNRSGEGGSIQQEAIMIASGELEHRAIQYFLKKLDRIYQENLKPFYASRQLNDLTKRPLTLTVLSNLLIGFEVLGLFRDKTFQTHHRVFSIITQREHLKQIGDFEKRFNLNRLARKHPSLLQVVYYSVEADSLEKLIQAGREAEYITFYTEPGKELLTKVHRYFESGRTGDDSTTIKGFINRILGQFLILSTGGIKSYNYELANRKVITNLERIFEASVFFILSLDWSFREERAKQILLLDLLHYIHPAGEWTETTIKQFRERLDRRKEQASIVNSSFEKNEAFFFGQLIPAYQQWNQMLNCSDRQNRLKSSLASLPGNTMVYDRKIGFCEFISWRNRTLTLAKPGLPYDHKTNSGMMKGISYPKDTIFLGPRLPKNS